MLDFILVVARVLGSLISLWVSFTMARRLTLIGHGVPKLSRFVRWRKRRRRKRKQPFCIPILCKSRTAPPKKHPAYWGRKGW